MTTYLALNKKRLSQLRYHPFWGLSRLTNNTQRSCYDDAVFLQQHSATKQGLIEQIKQVKQWSWFVRAVYWVLNINNYRVNRYQLLSYVSLSIYQQEFQKMPPYQQEHIDEVGGFVILLTSCALGAVLLSAFGAELLGALSHWFNQRLQPFMSPDIELYSPDIEAQSCGLLIKSPTSDHATEIPAEPIIQDDANQNAANQATIVVTNHIRDLLTTLGLSPAVGDSISFQAVRKAYRYQLLQTHPDKAGAESAPACRAVMAAYQLLLESFAQQALTQKHVSFNAVYEHEVMEWAKLRKEVNVYCKKVDEYVENVDRYVENVDRYVENVDKYCAGVVSFGEDVRQFGLKVDEHIDYYEKKNEELRARNAANGLPDLTDEEVDEFVKDPVGFTIKIRQRDAEMIRQQRMQTSPDESVLSNTASNESGVSSASCHL